MYEQNLFETQDIDKYFVSKQSKYEFILIHMDGKSRNLALGLADNLYEDEEAATAWYHQIRRNINDPRAITVLERLYGNIMDCYEDEDE